MPDKSAPRKGPTKARRSRTAVSGAAANERAPRLAQSVEQLAVPLAELHTYEGNPRRGDLEAIKESLLRNGQYRPIVVNARTSEVLAGNHTLLAAKELGWKTIAATYVDADPERAKRIVLADNRTNDLAGYDSQALVELLQDLPDLEGTGYDQAALAELLEEFEPLELPGAEEPVPPRRPNPNTRPGDLYLLGRHRLLCADAQSPDAYKRLLSDQRADALWSDPPYGVSYEGKTAERLRIAGDGEGIEELLRAPFIMPQPSEAA